MKSFFKYLFIFSLIYFLYILPGLIFPSTDFYQQIKLPSYAPKPIVFAIVWPILYAIFAGFITYKIAKKALSKELKASFLMNYVVMFFYNPAFFYLKSTFLGFAVTLLSFTTGILIVFYLIKENRLEASIFTPYILWTLFASVLSCHIYFIN